MANANGQKARRNGPIYSNSQLAALFSSIGEGLVVTDDHGLITRINKTALEIFGYKRSELINQHYINKIIAVRDDGSHINVMDRPIAKAFLTGEVISEKILYLRKDGTTIPTQVTISPLMLKGKPIGAVQLFRDITSEFMIDKLKSDFLSLASHQLRTPLSSVNVYTGMLLDGMAGKVSKLQAEYLRTILISANRMNQLIDTLLNITNIESGGIAVTPYKTHISKLVEQVVRELEPLIDEKGIAFHLEYKSKVRIVKTDGLLLKEILVNLLTNAIKYTAYGGTIVLKVKNDDTQIIFSVKDNGYGIPKHLQSRIFSKFFRADNILEHDVSGTGLGLYLIKMIAEHLDGDLWFESVENQGSTFYFYLPIKGSIAKEGKFNPTSSTNIHFETTDQLHLL